MKRFQFILLVFVSFALTACGSDQGVLGNRTTIDGEMEFFFNRTIKNQDRRLLIVESDQEFQITNYENGDQVLTFSKFNTGECYNATITAQDWKITSWFGYYKLTEESKIWTLCPKGTTAPIPEVQSPPVILIPTETISTTLDAGEVISDTNTNNPAGGIWPADMTPTPSP